MPSTIKDVAKAARVNISTASRVLNQVPGKWAKDETRDKILKIAEQLSYRPSHYARSMRSGKTNIIGLMIPDLLNPLYAELAKEIKSLLIQNGKHLVIEDTGGEKFREIDGVYNLIAMKVDGFIIVPIYPTSLEKPIYEAIQNQKKIVMIHQHTFPQVDHIWVDRSSAFESIFKHLKNQGRKKILFIKASIDGQYEEENDIIIRLARAAGYESTDIHIDHSPSTPEGGRAIIQKHFTSSKNSFDAVIASSDTMMLGGYSELLKQGLSIPNDVAFISGDDTYLSQYASPAISSIQSSVKSLAETSVQYLMDRISKTNSKIESKTTTISPQFIPRNSS